MQASFDASHSDSPQVNYYGSGPDSLKSSRPDFRREETVLDLNEAAQANRYASQVCRLGQLFLNVGPGTSTSVSSTESKFGPQEAPGIDDQSNYLIAGCSEGIDLRNFKDDPHNGTYL